MTGASALSYTWLEVPRGRKGGGKEEKYPSNPPKSCDRPKENGDRRVEGEESFGARKAESRPRGGGEVYFLGGKGEGNPLLIWNEDRFLDLTRVVTTREGKGGRRS